MKFTSGETILGKKFLTELNPMAQVGYIWKSGMYSQICISETIFYS